MGFYEKLYNSTEGSRQAFMATPLIERGVKGELSLESYVAFLTEAYHHVKHTVPLLMACGSRVPHEPRWIREALAEYVEEEKNHEMWILNDIEACGVDPKKVRFGQPRHETEMMVAYAYYTIDRINPLGFFGMVQVLEGTSIEVALKAADAIQSSLNLPDNAFSYLNSHGALDIEHMNFYRDLMDKIENKDDQDAIVHCANRMYRLYGDVFRSIPL